MLEHGKYQILLTEDEVKTLKRSKKSYVGSLGLICFVGAFSGVFLGGQASFLIAVASAGVGIFVLQRFSNYWEMNHPNSFIELDAHDYATLSELVISMPEWQPVFVRALEQGIKLRRRDLSFLSVQSSQFKAEQEKKAAMDRILDLKELNERVESEKANAGRASGRF